MDFSFFTENNKSGYKTREGWLEKNHPEVFNKIIEHSSKINLNLSYKEKIFFYFNNLKERPKCKTCNGEIKFRERFDKPYGDFCSLDCINNNLEEMIKRQKKTFNQKYGVDFYPQHKDFKKKVKKTKLKNFGDENYINLEKMKKTKLEKYGDENYSNIEKGKKTNLKKYGAENYSKSLEYFNIINNKFKLLYPKTNFIDVHKKTVKILCDECNKECVVDKHILHWRYNNDITVCTYCNPIGMSNTSSHEKKLAEFFDELNIDYIQSHKILKNKRELDFFIPNHKLAIEIDGIYFHNELFMDSDYHLEKTNECEEKGINLIHIFEDEWMFKKEIVKSIIKNKLNITDRVIYGRSCKIKEINSDECKNFLEENHVQGNVNSKVRLGLFLDNELVSVMCFSKGRIIMGGKKDEWELTRFCNKINTKVLGSASKLFNFFVKNYIPEKIISYSDKRYFDGGMYDKLGFKKISESKPNYWYVINGLRQHRFNYRKEILVKEGFDKNKTEKEIMFDRKIYRVYDCGNVRWEYKN